MRPTSTGPFVGMLFAMMAGGVAQAAEGFLSHRPMRPLATPSDRPLGEGPAYYVDAANGRDANDGSRDRPWQTVNHGLQHLQPGATLYLRGGTFYEHLVVPHSGEAGRPITLRSYPGELAIIDGGLREFYEHPESAWQPLADGAKDEYVSTRTYPAFAQRAILHAFVANGWEPFYGKEDERPVVLGNFGDSMVPLHGYRTLADLRDDSMLWDIDQKFENTASVNCGPGLWFNRQTNRIHIRLAHTTLDGLGEHGYRGVTNPCQIPLVISGPAGSDVLSINGIAHLVVQDLVLRGASGSPLINLYGSTDISFDGVTVYGGSPSLLVGATDHLRIVNTAFRSLAAPWTSRAAMKYRGTPSYVIHTTANKPQNHDFEFAYNEFTDGHDFAWLRYVTNLKFHHNYVDNFNDDGLEPGAKTRDQELYIHQNLLARCLMNFTLHEIDKDESPAEVNPGSGVYITRNVIDLRRGTFKFPPREPDPTGSYLNQIGALCGDHSSPTWPQYYFYHNTVVRADRAYNGHYGFGMGGQGLRNTQRRTFNNIFVQLEKLPGLTFGPGNDDVRVDGNLHWSVADGPGYQGDFFKPMGRAAARAAIRIDYGMQHDQFADPKFARLDRDPQAPLDLALQAGSPAIDAGVTVPVQWLDPLRPSDEGTPDLGALPVGHGAWRVGVRGRLSAFEGDRN